MKQPRVPEYRNGEDMEKYMRTLILFLKDFCQEAWTQGRALEKAVSGIAYPVTSVNGKTGNVTLDAADVGALADEARGEG
ncbi:MAG: hypothetical protein IJ418_22785 [Clostridia bacterium]|nr:hypothetical protein [Clostridia bacterium]